jgi:hypothetical protein
MDCNLRLVHSIACPGSAAALIRAGFRTQFPAERRPDCAAPLPVAAFRDRAGMRVLHGSADFPGPSAPANTRAVAEAPYCARFSTASDGPL